MKWIVILLLIGIILILGCTTRIPINSDNELSNSACEAQGGHLASIQNDGTACASSEIDLGKVTDVKCVCQCCK